MMAKIVLVVYLQFSFESHFVPTNCCYFVPVQKNYSRQPVTLSCITVNFCATPMRIPSSITVYILGQLAPVVCFAKLVSTNLWVV